MKSFIYKLILFFIPLGIYLLLAAIIDPYHYFKNNTFIKNDVKANISYKIHYPLWKLTNFKTHPTATILLGDSRTDAISTNLITKLTKKPCTNLAYGGGSLQEIIATFWEANKYIKLSHVYIGINFNLYNSYNNNNRVEEALELNKNFFAIALNRYAFKSIFYMLRFKFFGIPYHKERPNMTKDEFWNYQLNTTIKSFYKRYLYPKKYHAALLKIANYCKKNNIRLVFFMPPTYIGLQKKVGEFNLLKAQQKFKTDLNKIGKVYDFDVPSVLTKNKANFKDPFHIKHQFINQIFNEILIKENQVKGKGTKIPLNLR